MHKALQVDIPRISEEPRFQSIHLRINPMPAPRMTQRSKWANPQAKEYFTFKNTIGWLTYNVIYPYSSQDLLAISCRFNRFGRECDGDNMLKALIDALQSAEIIPNDKKVVEVHYFVTYTNQEQEAFIDLHISKVDPDKFLLQISQL